MTNSETPSGTPKRSRLRGVARWLGRGLLFIATLVLIAAMVGARWERAEHQAFVEAAMEAPGEMVSVGDHDLHVVTLGTGSPGLLLMAGLGDDYRGWREIGNGLADSVRVVAYDRPGFGWSPPPSADPDLPSAVADAHALLSNPDLFSEPPIVVGHSLGGMIARELALAHPELVSGLVLVDATPPDPMPRPVEALLSIPYRVFSVLGRTGVTRWMFYRSLPDATREEQLRWGHLNASGARMRAVWRELRGHLGFDATEHSPGALGALPLTVLSARAPEVPLPGLSGVMARLDAAKREITEESSRSRFVQVETGHYIHHEAPETVVAEILRMVRQAPGSGSSTPRRISPPPPVH